MPFASPDDGTGVSTNQSVIFTEDWQILSDGISRKNCVLQGCLTTATTLMTLNIALGSVLSNNAMFAVAAGTVAIGTADATNPRFDYVVITSAGAKAVRAGTAAATPNPPALTANDVVLAVVYVPAGVTTILSTHIYDRRMMVEVGPITIASNNTIIETVNSTASVAYSTITVPASLLSRPQGTSGFNKIRILLAGSMLVATSYTLTVKTVFGGVTMTQDVTLSFNTDAAVRRAWRLQVELVCHAAADQNITLFLVLPETSNPVAPNTGIGDLDDVSGMVAPMTSISGTLNTDTTDRVMTVEVAMSAANANNKFKMEYYSAEVL